MLAEVSPAESAQFEAEFSEALAQAGAEFDLAPAEVVLNRWCGIAVMRANPLSELEQAQLVRAGLIVYAVVHERQRLIILRLV